MASDTTKAVATSPYAWGERLEVVVRHHARRAPGAIAVEQDGRTLTYAELVERADRVAASLAARGVARGDVVPLIVPRSPELVVAVLGVLRAGAAYLAIHPAWPPDRIARVVRRSGALHVVEGTAGVRELQGSTAPVPPEPVGGTDTACVFFTSGSSGEPKGALSPHRGPIRVLVGNPVLPLDEASVVLQAAPLPWDGMSLEVWAALLNGGRCVLVDEDVVALDAAALASARRRGVNTLWLTASLLNVFVDEAPALLTGLRLLMTGGERVSPRHLAAVLAQDPVLRLVNGYGPAENTIFTTTHIVTADDVATPSAEVPIGTPVPRTSIILLDDNGQPLPTGLPGTGELAVSGDGLAAGYLGDPAETARRFVTIGGVTHYRTGDLVELGGDGVLRFRDRRDRQVKVSGVRVELGEVESVVERHPAVASCRALAVREREAGSLTLVAAYTTHDGQPVDGDRLRKHVAAALVPAMVPARLQHVIRLPLGATGKVDAAALEAELAAVSGSVAAGGHDPITDGLAALVGSPGLTPTDNLFDHGLTSLDAVRCAAWLSGRLGTTVLMSDLYRLRSAAALRDEFDGRATGDVLSAAHPNTPAPLSPAQRRFWLAEQTGPGLADNSIIVAYRLVGPVRVACLRAALADVVQRQTALRDRYTWRDDGPVVESGDPLPLVVEDLRLPSGDRREAVEAAVADWWDRPFDLESTPLRLGLAVEYDGVTLLVHVHHIAFDGWSEQVFLDDLATAYGRRLADLGAPGLPPLPVTRVEHDRWERSRLDGWLRAEEPFWRRTVDRIPPPAFPGPSGALEGPRREITSVVDADVVGRMRSATGRSGAPALAALAAAVARAVGTVFDRDDVCIGTVSAGRHLPQAQELVGYFVNPVLLSLRGVRAGPADLLCRTSATVTSALTHSRTPFDDLVRVLSPIRGRHPWFQTFAVLQHPLELRPWDGDVTVERLRVRPPRTAIELMVEAYPRSDGSWELVTLWRADGTAVDGAAEAIAAGVPRSFQEFGAGPDNEGKT